MDDLSIRDRGNAKLTTTPTKRGVLNGERYSDARLNQIYVVSIYSGIRQSTSVDPRGHDWKLGSLSSQPDGLDD